MVQGNTQTNGITAYLFYCQNQLTLVPPLIDLQANPVAFLKVLELGRRNTVKIDKGSPGNHSPSAPVYGASSQFHPLERVHCPTFHRSLLLRPLRAQRKAIKQNPGAHCGQPKGWARLVIDVQNNKTTKRRNGTNINADDIVIIQLYSQHETKYK